MRKKELFEEVGCLVPEHRFLLLGVYVEERFLCVYFPLQLYPTVEVNIDLVT